MLITPDILAKLAPRTPKAKRDRFIPFLNEACPRYNINTELRLAAFLATICFESDYFKTTVEYRATRPSRAKTLQDKYWHTGFYGRGLIQLTHRSNYEAFLRGVDTGGPQPDFVANPEYVAEPKWAVESACWFWQANNLNRYADKGQFFAIQGITNRGNAKKEALGYPDRLKLYDTALRAIPDDFFLNANHELDPSVQNPPNDGATSLVTIAASVDQSVQDQPTTLVPESAPSFLDKVFSPVEKAKQKWDALTLDPSKISGGSWLTTFLSKVSGYLLAIVGWFTSNPVYLVVGVLLVIAGIWYFSKSRDRRDARLAALTSRPLNQVNVEVANT